MRQAYMHDLERKSDLPAVHATFLETALPRLQAAAAGDAETRHHTDRLTLSASSFREWYNSRERVAKLHQTASGCG